MDNIKTWKQTGTNSVVIPIVLYLHQKMQNTHFIKDKFYIFIFIALYNIIRLSYVLICIIIFTT